MKRSVLLSVLAVSAMAFAPIAPAAADVFGKLAMGSDGFLEGQEAHQQQALYAHDADISGNGRYVAFDGYFGGRTGVWRRDLQTGEVEPVAVGQQQEGNELCVAHEPCDAELPSISESGQYVSFTTTAQLTAADQDEGGTADHPNVWVRNMDVAESDASAYTLVSAVSGKPEGLTYEGSSADGAVAAGRSAMSANGEEVVFVTTAVSNLAACEIGATPEAACAEGAGEAPAPDTPALQVAVRNLVTKETTLVSVEYDPATGQPIPDAPVSKFEGDTTYGAVYSPVSGAPQFPFSNRAYGLPASVGASISADGTTVAWMGVDIFKQAPMLPEETKASYSEPLWRRISSAEDPTRRVSGGSEPENPACIASGQLSLPEFQPGLVTASNPCQGPFAVEPTTGLWSSTVVNDVVPELSEDGDSVAFLASAQLTALGIDFGRAQNADLDDLFVVNMQEGLSRSEALRPLTQLVPGESGEAPIVDLAISPDGSQVAFSTQRIEFPLGAPAYVSQPQAVVGLAELFDVDLANNTLTRVTAGYEGGPSEHPHIRVTTTGRQYEKFTDGALSPSFSKDGDTLAFSSTASNLVYGDGNTPPASLGGANGSADGSDVFYLSRELFPPQSPETYISSPPGEPSITPVWTIGVTARSLANGSVRLYVEVPGAGTLSADSSSALAETVISHASAKRGRVNAKRGHVSTKRGRVSRTVVERDVSAARMAVGAGTDGLVELTLTLAAPYRTLASHPGGLPGTVEVVFSAAGQPTLKQGVAVTFVTKTKPSRGRASRASKRASSKARR
jgi:Tol biopolymer transport system component